MECSHCIIMSDPTVLARAETNIWLVRTYIRSVVQVFEYLESIRIYSE